MKRKSLKFIACAAIMAMTLSVTACGGSDETAPAAETEETTEVADEAADAETEDADEAADAETEGADEAADAETEGADEAADAETEGADEATDAETADEPETEAEADTTESSDITVESLLSDPEVMAQFEEGVASYEEQGMSVAVEAKGNELIVALTFTDSSLIQDGAAELLESGLDDADTAAKFEVLAGSLDQAVGADAGTCAYTVRYLDPDGNVLAERSFTAK